MDRCEQCQSLALEYLYDLLEGEELNDFLGHVEGCAACRAALEGARGQQQLLAAAARPAFPAVQFQPPPEELPVSLPLRPARPRRAWRRWAVAAAVLLAAAGLGVPAAHSGYDYAQARAQVAQHQAELAELNRRPTRRARNSSRSPSGAARPSRKSISRCASSRSGCGSKAPPASRPARTTSTRSSPRTSPARRWPPGSISASRTRPARSSTRKRPSPPTRANTGSCCRPTCRWPRTPACRWRSWPARATPTPG